MNIIENSAGTATRAQSVARHKVSRSALVGAVLVASIAWLCVPTAWAAKADALSVTLDVTPKDAVTPPAPQTYSVSVSRTGLDSNVSYHVTVANTGNNVINQVVFTATTSVTGSASGIAGYSAFVNLGPANPNCTQPTAPAVNTVTCAIGQMKSGDSQEFFLIFRAPNAGSTIEFAGATTFSSGNSPNAPPANVTRTVGNSIALITVDPTAIASAVKTVLAPNGGTFFTGADPGGVPNSSNKFSTFVVVPSTTGASQTVTDNGIQHDSLPSYTCNNSAPGYFCYGLRSKIDILDAKNGSKVFFDQVAPGQVVKITLRQDASSITVKLPWPFINDVKIFYNPSGVVDGNGALVPPCTGNLPQRDQPCVKSRTDRTVAHANPNDPADDPGDGDRDSDDTLTGYYEYEIWAVDNGNFSW